MTREEISKALRDLEGELMMQARETDDEKELARAFEEAMLIDKLARKVGRK